MTHRTAMQRAVFSVNTLCSLLWSPYGIGQTIIFSYCRLFFFFLSSFFLRLSVVAGWMSAIYLHTWCGLSANLRCRSETCCTRLAENTGCKKVAKNRHLGTIAQLCRAMSSQLGKKLLSSNMSSTCPGNTANFGPLATEIGPVVWGHPCKFQRVSRLGSVTARHCSSGR